MLKHPKTVAILAILSICVPNIPAFAAPHGDQEEAPRHPRPRVLLHDKDHEKDEDKIKVVSRKTRAEPENPVCAVATCGIATIFIFLYLVFFAHFSEQVGRNISLV